MIHQTIAALVIAAACLAVGQPGYAQDKKSVSKKPPASSKRDAGIRTPELKPLTPPQIFAKAFEYIRQGQFSDAEELFLAGLKLDNKDPRAWEWLARSQAALKKDAEAEQSLQESVRRGLPREREELARAEMFFAFPDKLPEQAVACLKPEARLALEKIRVPRDKQAFEIDTELRTKPGNKIGITHRYAPIGPGLFIEDTTTYVEPARSGPSTYQHLDYLGAFLSCQIDARIVDSVKVTGVMFPLHVGNKFVVEVVEGYNVEGSGRGYPDHTTYSCAVTDSRPASPDVVPTHPPVGRLITVECDWDLNGHKTKFKRFFSSYLGAFIPFGPGSDFKRFEILTGGK